MLAMFGRPDALRKVVLVHTKAARPCGHHLGETFFRLPRYSPTAAANVRSADFVIIARAASSARTDSPTKADLRGRIGRRHRPTRNARILVDAAGVDGFKQHIERLHLGHDAG